MQPPTTAPFRLRPAQAPDLPAGELGLLLHGRYVDPTHQRCGIGSQLLDAAEAAAGRRVLMAFWSRRRRMPMVFFEARGLRRLPVGDPARHYPHRFWMAIYH
jgi:GNAT superfamily N-acetyltransferase